MSKRGHYGLWSENDLLLSVAAYKNGDYGLNECSRVYGVPKAIIKRYADEKNFVSNNVKAFGRPPIFSPHMEKIISEHILHLEECFFGLSIKELENWLLMSHKIMLCHILSAKKRKLLVKKWFYAFLKRNPHLALRKP